MGVSVDGAGWDWERGEGFLGTLAWGPGRLVCVWGRGVVFGVCGVVREGVCVERGAGELLLAGEARGEAFGEGAGGVGSPGALGPGPEDGATSLVLMVLLLSSLGV